MPLYLYSASCLPEWAPLGFPFACACIPYSDQNQKPRNSQGGRKEPRSLMTESRVERLITRNEHRRYFYLLGIFLN